MLGGVESTRDETSADGCPVGTEDRCFAVLRKPRSVQRALIVVAERDGALTPSPM
jgi:hypothetical protein